MAKSFNSADIALITGQVYDLQSRVENGANLYNVQRNNIKKAVEKLVNVKLLELLKGIPIDNLVQEKTGLRVKALKEAGFENYLDVYQASLPELTRVNGISEAGAENIKSAINNHVNTARNTIKVKLNSDDKNMVATIVVGAVAVYLRCIGYTQKCRNLSNREKQKIQTAVMFLSDAKSNINWLFMSREKKNQAIASFDYLQGLLTGSFSNEINQTLLAIDRASQITPDEAWQEFENNPVLFYNIIEEILPEVLGNEDTLYGLPEALAVQVVEEQISTEGLKCTLRRYQELGVQYILHQKDVLLGDEMGLGKTVQAIAAMVSLTKAGASHFMVVCPASVLSNWCKEISRHSTLTPVRIHGNNKESAFEAWKGKGGVAVTTYETTVNIKMDITFKYSMLVVDEAHYVKNPNALRSQNVLRLSQHAERKLLMTGTALENRVGELIQLMRVLQPQIAAQAEKYAFMSGAQQFRELIAPVYYRRKRDDVLTELPELIENEEWAELNEEEQKVYEASVFQRNFHTIRRVSWNVEDLSRSSKATRMAQLIEEAKSEGRKIIVFSFYLDTIDKIYHWLGDCCMPVINGSVSPSRRLEIIERFEDAPAGTVLISQIMVGGTGLNIQSASVVIICEPQLKPSIENQAISRAYRMGQTRNVLVYRLLSENTVDERIMEKLAAKQAEFDAFADISEAALAQQDMLFDNKTQNEIIDEEIERINKERGKRFSAPPEVEQWIS